MRVNVRAPLAFLVLRHTPVASISRVCRTSSAVLWLWSIYGDTGTQLRTTKCIDKKKSKQKTHKKKLNTQNKKKRGAGTLLLSLRWDVQGCESTQPGLRMIRPPRHVLKLVKQHHQHHHGVMRRNVLQRHISTGPKKGGGLPAVKLVLSPAGRKAPSGILFDGDHGDLVHPGFGLHELNIRLLGVLRAMTTVHTYQQR